MGSTYYALSKNHGSLHSRVDHRKLNAVTICDSYPLSRMGEYIESLGEATVLSTVDANSVYWQIEIYEQDRGETASSSQHGLHRFFRIPFGQKNSSAIFQRAMDVIDASV